MRKLRILEDDILCLDCEYISTLKFKLGDDSVTGSTNANLIDCGTWPPWIFVWDLKSAEAGASNNTWLHTPVRPAAYYEQDCRIAPGDFDTVKRCIMQLFPAHHLPRPDWPTRQAERVHAVAAVLNMTVEPYAVCERDLFLPYRIRYDFAARRPTGIARNITTASPSALTPALATS